MKASDSPQVGAHRWAQAVLNPSGCVLCHFQALATISGRPYCGVHFSSVRALALSAQTETGSPGRRATNSVGICLAGGLRGGGQHLLHAGALAGAQVEDVAVAAGQEVQRLQVGVGQIQHVDVVADAGAVGGGVVGAEHLDRRCPPGRRLHHQRDQVRGVARVLADAPVQHRAGGVEVAQGHPLQPERLVEPGQHALDLQLALAVGVLGAQRRRLHHRQHLGVAVDRRRRGEHELLHPLLAHGLEQLQRAEHVVVEVLARVAHRFACGLVGGEVDDRFYAVLAQHLRTRSSSRVLPTTMGVSSSAWR